MCLRKVQISITFQAFLLALCVVLLFPPICQGCFIPTRFRLLQFKNSKALLEIRSLIILYQNRLYFPFLCLPHAWSMWLPRCPDRPTWRSQLCVLSGPWACHGIALYSTVYLFLCATVYWDFPGGRDWLLCVLSYTWHMTNTHEEEFLQFAAKDTFHQR